MARRWWVRGIVWTGIGFACLIGVLLFALVLITQSAFGRERVRQVAERLAGRYLLGSLHLGALRFGPGCALAIDSAAMRGPDDSLLVSLGPARAQCQFGALVRRRLIITSLEVTRPHVIVRQSPSGVWNWSRAIRPDTAPAPPSTGPARAVVAGPVRLTDGSVIVEVPWAPPDSMRGAARDRAIATALGAGLPDVRRAGTGLVQRRELSGITIDAPLVRTEIGDTTTVAQLNRISVTASDPPTVVHRIGGRVAIVGNTADLDLPVVSFARSSARASGRVDWSVAGQPAVDARVVVDTVAFADLAWLAPDVALDGGGRFTLAIKTDGGTSPADYTITGADLHMARSAVRGDATVRIDSANAPVIRQVALDLAPLHTDLLRTFMGDVVPQELRGALTAHVVGRGGANGALRIDSLDGRYADERTSRPVVSRFTGRGGVTLGGAGGIAFSELVVSADPIDMRTVARVVPALVPLSGRLTGTVTLDSTLAHLRIARADLRYAEGSAAPLRVMGSGRVDTGEPMGFDLRLDAQPLAPAALARSYPALATLPAFEGPIEVRGTPTDVTLSGTVRSDGGSLGLAARYRETSEGVAIRATARVRDADPRSLSGRATVPSGRIDADLDVDLRGDSLTALRGNATVANLSGGVSGVALEPSSARLTLTESRIVAETLRVATAAGIVTARGALGLRASTRDTLHVNATLSLAELAPLVRAMTPPDSTSSRTTLRDSTQRAAPAFIDSLRGQVVVQARVVGAIDSMDVDAEADGSDIVAPSLHARRLHATATLAGFPAMPRGSAAVRVDSLVAGDVSLASLDVAARSEHGDRWQVALGTADGDRPGGAAAGVVAILTDTTVVAFDSLAVRVPGADLRLTRPARLRRTADGTIALDSLELRGGRGTLITAAGVYRDSGAIAMQVDVRDAPVSLAVPGSESDSLRLLLDLQTRLDGTAREPRGGTHVRARFVGGDSTPIDSVIVNLAYDAGRARVQAEARNDAATLLTARATIPVELSLSPAKAVVQNQPLDGEVRIDSLYLPDLNAFTGVLATAGVLRTRLTLSGTARRPRAVGDASLQGGVARIPALGIEIRDANTALDLSEERITIKEARVRAGEENEGRAELSGFVGLTDSSSIDLRLRSASMPVMRRAETADVDVSTDLRLAGPYTKPTLSGRITVDRATIRLPELGRAGVVGVDDTAYVRLLDSLAPTRARVVPSRPVLERVDIGDVEVAMGPNVWLRSSEASVQLGGSIALAKAAPGPGVAEGQLALRGKLVTQRGNYRLTFGAISRSFELEEGAVEFNGEPELNPRLNINAIYTREAIGEAAGSSPRVRAHFGGTLERPELTLSSADSRLSESELMSYLVTGQSSFAVGDAFDEGVVTGELVATATGALAQRLAGGMFDMVNVTPGATTGRDDARGATASDAFAASRLGVGKQLSSRLFLKMDAGLCALTGGSMSGDLGQTLGVSLDYRFNRNLLGSLSSAPSTSGATCASQAASRSTAATPRQWGLDFSRIWRF